jgi:hypothetical protein
MINGTAEERVARGVALMDEFRPDWRDYVDLGIFHLKSGDTCIIGQAVGFAFDPDDETQWHRIPEVARTNYQIRGFWARANNLGLNKVGDIEYNGFDIDDDGDVGYDELHELWIEAIEKG